MVFITGDDQPGSTNDSIMCDIIGSNWRSITGAHQHRADAHSSPGYTHSKHWRRVIYTDFQWRKATGNVGCGHHRVINLPAESEWRDLAQNEEDDQDDLREEDSVPLWCSCICSARPPRLAKKSSKAKQAMHTDNVIRERCPNAFKTNVTQRRLSCSMRGKLHFRAKMSVYLVTNLCMVGMIMLVMSAVPKAFF